MQADITPISSYRAKLGEGPLWDHRTRRLLFVDILDRTLIVQTAAGAVERQIRFDGGVTCIGLADNGGYIATSETGFMLLDSNLGVTWKSSRGVSQPHLHRFNDGKVCPAGRFWAGTMARDLGGREGQLFCLRGQEFDVRDEDFRVTNGPAFAPDGSALYLADTLDRIIYRFDLLPDCRIQNRKIFAVIDEAHGGPDGMTVDSQGRLYVAHFGGARISRFMPDGTPDGCVAVPAQNVTSLTFGGPDFATLFATSAHCTFAQEMLKGDHVEGATFAIDCGARGLPQPLFKCEVD